MKKLLSMAVISLSLPFLIGDLQTVYAVPNTVIDTINVNSAPSDVAVNEQTDRVYSSTSGTSTITVINTLNDAKMIIATPNVSPLPERVAVNTLTNTVYSASPNSNMVDVINGNTNNLITSIPVGGNPTGIAVNEQTNRIYVTSIVANTVTVIDGNTNMVIGLPINVGLFPIDVVVDEINNKIYVANLNSNSVSVIDGNTNMVVTIPSVGLKPFGIGIDTMKNRVYVANRDSANVDVINTNTNSVIDTIAVGQNPRGVAVHDLANRVYVTSLILNTVSVIDTLNDANMVIATINVGLTPRSVDVNTLTNRAYVSNLVSSTISVIETDSAPLPIIDGTVTKTCTPNTQTEPGTIEWQLSIKNTSPVESLEVTCTGDINGAPEPGDNIAEFLAAGQTFDKAFTTNGLVPGDYKNSIECTFRDQSGQTFTRMDMDTCSVKPVVIKPPVGGEYLPINTTSLLLAGAQSFSWMIPVILSGIGIGLFAVSRKSEI